MNHRNRQVLEVVDSFQCWGDVLACRHFLLGLAREEKEKRERRRLSRAERARLRPQTSVELERP